MELRARTRADAMGGMGRKKKEGKAEGRPKKEDKQARCFLLKADGWDQFSTLNSGRIFLGHFS